MANRMKQQDCDNRRNPKWIGSWLHNASMIFYGQFPTFVPSPPSPEFSECGFSDSLTAPSESNVELKSPLRGFGPHRAAKLFPIYFGLLSSHLSLGMLLLPPLCLQDGPEQRQDPRSFALAELFLQPLLVGFPRWRAARQQDPLAAGRRADFPQPSQVGLPRLRVRLTQDPRSAVPAGVFPEPA